MAPYLILCAAVVLLGIFLCERHPSRRNDIIFLSITSVALVVMSTIRGISVGVDYEPYLQYFQRVCNEGMAFLTGPENIYRIEFGYAFLNYLISFFGDTQVVFALCISVLCIGLTAVFIYKYAPSVWMGMFIFISFGFFSYTLCTLRNQIAICIFMFAIPLLQKKKFLPYLLIVLLCATFHKSMLVLLPMYFFAWLPFNWKFISGYGLLTLFFIIFSEPIMGFVTQFVYKDYQVGSYYMMGRDFRTGFIPIVMFLVLFLLRKLLLERDPRNQPLLNLSLYTALLFCMTFKHFVFQRFGLMIFPVAILILPELMMALRPPADKLQALADAKKALENAGGAAKKQALQKVGILAAELKDKQSMYYAAMGFILFAGFLYFCFLLSANRLLLVPYVTMWAPVPPIV